MNRIRYIRRIAAVLGGLAAALAAVGATPASARPDPDGLDAPAAPAQIPVPVRAIVAGGMPGWQITLIAVGAALAAAAIAVLLDRALTSRRHVIRHAVASAWLSGGDTPAARRGVPAGTAGPSRGSTGAAAGPIAAWCRGVRRRLTDA
jgi:hypothetical protein